MTMILHHTEVKPTIAAFDFDITMTTKDTFTPFLFWLFGHSRVYASCLRLAPEGVKVGLGLSNRDRFKEKIVAQLFLGESCDRLGSEGLVYAKHIEKWIRPAAIERVNWHKKQGHRLVMVSASLDLYLKPIAEKLGFHDLLCTMLSVNNHLFDGQLLGGNCRGTEKVRRLETLQGPLSEYELFAYGDSAGDREMLAVATHPHYRVFEKSNQPNPELTL